MARIRYRLLLVNVIVVAVPLVGISFAHRHEAQLLHGLEGDMIHQAELLRAVLEADPGGLALPARGPALAAAARTTRTRIRLLDDAGRVVADSHGHGPPEGAEPPAPRLLGRAPFHAPEAPKPLDVAARPEVRAALAGRYGSATRLWDKQQRVYLFAALPLHEHGRIAGVVYVTRSTYDVKVELYELRSWLGELLAGAVAVTALLSLVLAMTIDRPLRRLTLRAQRVAARAEPGGPDPAVRRADEIGQLARALAAMTAELERRAHDAKALAADLSHELKNPLASIRGATELLADGAHADAAARDRFLAMILDDVARLDRIVSRLLELARIEDDRALMAPVDLAAVAREIAARAWAAPVELRCEPVIVTGRAHGIAAAVENLVANAVQHAAPGTPVRVSVARTPDAARITVDNRGPALSEAAQRRVWDRFYTTRVASGGSGLGLSIVRSVAVAHRGHAGVACAGGVTSFWLELAA